LRDDFFAIYGEAARGRRVSTRLHHRQPPSSASRRAWPLRHADFDVLDHVNNVRYFEAIDDELARALPGRVADGAEVEFRGAVGRNDAVELASEVRVGEGATQLAVWLLAEGEVRLSAVVAVGVG
jgi:acyl-ACP thioesterase